MNSDTSTSTQSSFPTSSDMSTSSSGMGQDTNGTVQRMAQKAHEAVDKLEQTLGSSSDKVMGLQQEYGDMAREQVRENPLAALGIAFAAGVVFSKLFMR